MEEGKLCKCHFSGYIQRLANSHVYKIWTNGYEGKKAGILWGITSVFHKIIFVLLICRNGLIIYSYIIQVFVGIACAGTMQCQNCCRLERIFTVFYDMLNKSGQVSALFPRKRLLLQNLSLKIHESEAELPLD